MLSSMAFAGRRYTYQFDICRPIDATEPTVCAVKPTLVRSLFGVKSLSSMVLRAVWTNSAGKETFYDGYTTGVTSEKGHWFTKNGLATTRTKNYCIKVGADAYLPKPFELKVLNALLANLWNKRKTQWQAFRRADGDKSVNDLEITNIDRDFINKVIHVIEQNINSPLLDVDFLASQLNMSRSTLSRKLKAITGDTPLGIIKTVKLKYAYSLLKGHTMSVVEVVEAIGYNDRNTFAKSFKEMFGVLPSKV